ncbi:hypothetical protein F7984_01465 [Pradoshia sp. D12]|uniref:hypothetical protein n=1 Tax=Bacillaceae TaxID=186817 RepID=UPI00112CC256|nr:MULTISPECIES: hypothetical protein [Bacillaceae]QFK70025.1 hypothetical protein F7984_01465 [Pradoshia sp. D12]TPF70585.1 hypothetical protein FHY44_16600 [Bacillus sp. D12]
MKLLYKYKLVKESSSTVKMLMLSLLGIILCITCLMGTTWSWFNDNVTTSIQSIKAANYSITVDIQDREALEDGKYNLSEMIEGKGYMVTVKASGSASTGYFRISGPDGFAPLYSTQLAPGEDITFTFYPSITGEYSFESAWGTYIGENTIKDSDIIGTPKQSEENIEAMEELGDTEISNDPVDSPSVPETNEEENLDKDLNEDSEEEINKDLDGELDEITSTVQPSEVPDDTEETFGNTEQNQE